MGRVKGGAGGRWRVLVFFYWNLKFVEWERQGVEGSVKVRIRPTPTMFRSSLTVFNFKCKIPTVFHFFSRTELRPKLIGVGRVGRSGRSCSSRVISSFNVVSIIKIIGLSPLNFHVFSPQLTNIKTKSYFWPYYIIFFQFSWETFFFNYPTEFEFSSNYLLIMFWFIKI